MIRIAEATAMKLNLAEPALSAASAVAVRSAGSPTGGERFRWRSAGEL